MDTNILMQKVLDLAIQGKLVPQDPNDEPVSVLLGRIQTDKERLIREGKIKQNKKGSIIYRRDSSYYEIVDGIERCIDKEIPFAIPESWEWVRLGNTCEIERGGSPRPIKAYLTESPSGINWIKIGDSDKGGKYISATKERIIPEGVRKSRMVHSGDFLLTNSMSFGRPYILQIDGCIHDGWLVLREYQKYFNIDFLYYLLSSSFSYSQFCSAASGGVVDNLNIDKAYNALFPLPPPEEQKRIATFIENIQQKISLIENDRRSIKELSSLTKSKVLDFAIRGKLVSQDPNDEPASVLLTRIREEKAKLVKDGLLKKKDIQTDTVIFLGDDGLHYERFSDGTAKCIEKEIPFEIPENWEWARLGTVCQTITGSTPPTKDMTLYGTEYPFYKPTDLDSGYWVESAENYVSKKGFESGRILPEKSVLVTCIGSVGKTGFIRKAGICNQQINAILPNNYIIPEYIYYLMCSDFIKNQIVEKASATTLAIVNKSKFDKIIVVIPPISEQKRIATLIDSTQQKISLIENN